VAAFLIHALVSGSVGPRLPGLQERAGVGPGGLGVALSGYAIGLFLGTRVVAALERRIGERRLIRLAVPCLALSLLAVGLAGDLVTLTASFVLLGAASGVLDVAMNGAAVHVEREVGRPIMTGIHGRWSAALLVAGLVAAGAAALDLSPPVHFALVAAAVTAFSVPALRGLLPFAEAVVDEVVAPAARFAAALRSRPVLLLGAFGFCAGIAQGAAHDWTSVYLDDVIDTSQTVAALGFAGFALGMTIARLLADRLIARLGPVRVVRAGAIVAVAGFALVLAPQHVGLAIPGFVLLGIGFAPAIPSAFSAAGNLPGAVRGALGWVVALCYVGLVLGPALIGLATHAAGLRGALLLPAAAAVLVAGLAPATRYAAGGRG
jgi:MFS family permease